MAPPPSDPDRRVLKLRPNRAASLLGGASYLYRLDDQVLEAHRFGKPCRTYPSKGYNRLEFANGRLYQTDGLEKHRSIRIRRWTVHPDDWAVFAKVAPKPRSMHDLAPMPPAQSAPPTPPAPPPPARERMTVRYLRKPVAWLLVAGVPLTVFGMLLWSRAYADWLNFDWWLSYAVLLAGVNAVVRPITALSSKVCFAYDPGWRAVTVRHFWTSSTSWFPHSPSERLEYSVYTGTIYKVAASGRRRRYVRKSFWLHGGDWAMIADHLLATAETPSGPRKPSGKPIQVRVNPWRAVPVVVGGFGLAILFFAADPSEPGFAWELLYAMIAGLSLLTSMDVVNHLTFRPFLTFDPEKGRVVIRPGTNRHAVFPSKDFERVEYSIYDARAYEVRSNGDRKRLPIPRWYMNRADWGAFADALIAHPEQSAAEPLENEGLPK